MVGSLIIFGFPFKAFDLSALPLKLRLLLAKFVLKPPLTGLFVLHFIACQEAGSGT